MNKHKYPLTVYVIQPIVKYKGMHKLHKITNTILEGLPHIKTHKLLGDINNHPYVYPDPCIIVPYNRYICEMLLDLVNSMGFTKTIYYDLYKYWYTDKNKYHYYKPIVPAFRGSSIKLNPTEVIDCILED